MDGGLCAACLAVGGAGMLHKLTAFAQIDGRKLMDLYQEGNRENAPYFFPEIKEQALALEKMEQRFLEYVETDFFSRNDSEYWVLEEDGVWISALRLYKISEGFYYMEALETHPDFRERGYAARLLAGVIGDLKTRGPFRLCDCVGKNNAAFLGVHRKCGFEIAAEAGINYLDQSASERCFGLAYTFKN